MVLSEKPLISEDSSQLEPTLLDELINHMSTLSSVYHRPPEAFVSKLKKKVRVFNPEAVAKKKKKAKHGKKGNLIERADYADEPVDDEHENGGTLIDFELPPSNSPQTLDPFGFLNAPQPVCPINFVASLTHALFRQPNQG